MRPLNKSQLHNRGVRKGLHKHDQGLPVEHWKELRTAKSTPTPAYIHFSKGCHVVTRMQRPLTQANKLHPLHLIFQEGPSQPEHAFAPLRFRTFGSSPMERRAGTRIRPPCLAFRQQGYGRVRARNYPLGDILEGTHLPSFSYL